MHMSQFELFHLFNAELVPSLDAVLKQRGYALKPEDREAMLKAADAVVAEFMADVDKHSKED